MARSLEGAGALPVAKISDPAQTQFLILNQRFHFTF